jgi:hypothetical protein
MGVTQNATASGFDSTPATDRQYLIEVNAIDLPANRPYVRLKCTESVNDPVNGSVAVLLSEPRYAGAVLPTAIE